MLYAEPPRYDTAKTPDPDGTGRIYKGREIAAVMGHQAAGWLERPEREDEEEPAILLKILDLKPEMIVADIGAGSGYHAVRLAPQVSKVLAVDIQQEMLDLINAKAKAKKIANVETILGKVDDPKLPESKVDLIILVDVYHEFSHPYEMTQQMVKALKPGGRIAFVEFKANDRQVPIKPLHTMSERQLLKEMEEFKELKHVQTKPLNWQNVIVFEKAKP
jgi:ubiquinone/menaquinone biosynthesis C-methylase UbiE